MQTIYLRIYMQHTLEIRHIFHLHVITESINIIKEKGK